MTVHPMKIAIQNQRKEWDRLLSLPYIPRQTIYDFDELLKSPNIKLLTGPRRVGKSTQALLMLRGKNFAYLNFDDNELLKKGTNSKPNNCLAKFIRITSTCCWTKCRTLTAGMSG